MIWAFVRKGAYMDPARCIAESIPIGIPPPLPAHRVPPVVDRMPVATCLRIYASTRDGVLKHHIQVSLLHRGFVIDCNSAVKAVPGDPRQGVYFDV